MKRDKDCYCCITQCCCFQYRKPKEVTSSLEEQEIILLKSTVKALAKMITHYRLGLPSLPEWVFNNIEKAKKEYGKDLTKII